MSSVEVSVTFTVPSRTDAFDYRDRVAARATELGWPEPHSAGIFMIGPVADLQWTVPQDQVARVLEVLRVEFAVSSVDVYDEEL